MRASDAGFLMVAPTDEQRAVAEWLEEAFPEEAIIRIYDDGMVELSMNRPSFPSAAPYIIDVDDIPGGYYIADVMFGEGGVSVTLRAGDTPESTTDDPSGPDGDSVS